MYSVHLTQLSWNGTVYSVQCMCVMLFNAGVVLEHSQFTICRVINSYKIRQFWLQPKLCLWWNLKQDFDAYENVLCRDAEVWWVKERANFVQAPGSCLDVLWSTSQITRVFLHRASLITYDQTKIRIASFHVTSLWDLGQNANSSENVNHIETLT